MKFLAVHANVATNFAFIEISKIAYTWLRSVPDNWRGRDDAATLALIVGQIHFHNRHYYDRLERDVQLPYKALLAAFHDRPDQVRELALKACSRKAPNEMDIQAFNDYMVDTDGGDRSIEESWDGPIYRPDHLFQSVCLETDALTKIMEEAPELASEIILALLIDVRRHYRKDWKSNGSDFGIYPDAWLDHEMNARISPGFYTRGPFLLFLKINPRVALEMVIRLINFVTEQWIKSKYKRP